MKLFRCSTRSLIFLFTAFNLSALSPTTLAYYGYSDIPENEVQGYWKPLSARQQNPRFEFFSGSTAVSSDMTLRTGRIEYKNQADELFYWEKASDGKLSLSVVAGDCPTRPLTTCPTIANVDIETSSIGKNRYYWDIDYDYLDANTADTTYRSVYRKKGLGFRKLSNGEIFLNSAANLAFGSPYSGYKANDSMSIVLDLLNSVVEVSANFPSDKQAKILNFDEFQELTSTTITTFPLIDGGSVDVDVVSSLSEVTMVSSKRSDVKAGGPRKRNYVLSWVIDKTIDFPAGVTAESVDLSAFKAQERRSQVLELFDRFITGPQLAEGDLYFSHFPSNFLTADGFGNEVSFSGESTGTVSFNNAIDETLGETKAFNWQQSNDGEVSFHFTDNDVTTSMRFLTEIDGGYRVLYSTPHPTLGTRYFIRDFIISADSVLDQSNLAGDYKVLNITSKPTGSYLFDVMFNADGSMSGDLSGFWFENPDGTIQSYECYDPTGTLIADYFDCLAAIQTNSYSFIWIRKIDFIHEKKNEYKAKYNSVILDPSVAPFPLNFAWTYRFTRLSN